VAGGKISGQVGCLAIGGFLKRQRKQEILATPTAVKTPNMRKSQKTQRISRSKYSFGRTRLMTNLWYYYDGVQACGPFQKSEMRDLIDSGVVKEDTFAVSANDAALGWVIAAETELSAFFKENSESDAKENSEHAAEENSGLVVVEDTQRFSLNLGFSSNVNPG
jgi:hypothetical protein